MTCKSVVFQTDCSESSSRREKIKKKKKKAGPVIKGQGVLEGAGNLQGVQTDSTPLSDTAGPKKLETKNVKCFSNWKNRLSKN